MSRWFKQCEFFAHHAVSRTLVVAAAFSLLTALPLAAQQSAPPPAAPGNEQNAQSAPPTAPLTTPAVTGPLQAAPPITIDGGPLGKLSLNGALSGMGISQSNHVSGDDTGHGALSNGQVWVQKADGWWQFYVQAGAYNLPSLGAAFLSTENANSDLFGPVPVGFFKVVPGKNTNIQIGQLPTILGAEYTFTFENMNIERGLLWNQEPAISRGIQVNQAMGKWAASLSWNDGFYSSRYSWLSGSLAYTKGAHSLAFQGAGNLGQTAYQTVATPVQNNSTIYIAMYTYTKGNWIIGPYYQYTDVPTNAKAGVVNGASTQSGALLASRTFKHGFSLAGRVEAIASTGSSANQSVNLLYGPGSSAWSLTATPTYQKQRFFVRGDVSYVRADSITAGSAFGKSGTKDDQARGVIEMGFLF